MFLILLLVMTATLATAHSGNNINIPAGFNPTIDGRWTGSEWDDATWEYQITGPGGTSYLRAKTSSGNLYMIIDSPWDTTPSVIPGWERENLFVAFDTSHNDGGAPQTDDYLFNGEYSIWGGPSCQGTGTGWGNMLTPAGYNCAANYSYGSPHSGASHRIEEFKIPLAYVGTIDSTSGFYVMVIDNSGDPDGTGPLGSTLYVEWPPAAGGNTANWPPGSDPCPAPNAWGNIYALGTNVGGIWVSVDKIALLAPYIALAAAIGIVIIGAVYTRKRWLPKVPTL